MVSSVGSIQNQAMDLMQQRKSQILEKLKNGDAEEAIVTGGNAFTESVWNKMLEGVDNYLDEVKEEQKIRFAKMDEEQQEKELLQKRLMEKEMQAESNLKEVLVARTGGTLDVPYGYLAKNGVIEYNGVIFVCDELHNAICLGDMTDESNVLSIPLTEGGCLKVNRDNISDLAKAISMFSPEDIRRIMEAIATDAKCQQMQQEMDETLNSISGSTTIVSKNQAKSGDEVTAEQIAELFRDKE
ncbi:MAG: hypothetical protein IKB01_00685 [Lachnospiraceae bacterium]|nr:hypothetical protein [Lachnospiraceae bacterium]